MYYTINLDGKVTFKVKGVKTISRRYTYEDLVSVFINKERFQFTDQVQFTNLKSKGTLVGIKVVEDAMKSYDVYKRLKRT